MSPREFENVRTRVASRRSSTFGGRFNYSSAKLRANFRIKVDLALGTGTRKRALTNLPPRHRELSRFPFKSETASPEILPMYLSPSPPDFNAQWISFKSMFQKIKFCFLRECHFKNRIFRLFIDFIAFGSSFTDICFKGVAFPCWKCLLNIEKNLNQKTSKIFLP